MLESDLLKQVRRLSVGAVRLFRNQVGALKDGDRWVQFGLCKGSSDLIGFKSHTITQEDVGRTVAIFVAIETKTERGRMREGQQEFIDAVRKHGGLAGVARSVEQAQAILEGK